MIVSSRVLTRVNDRACSACGRARKPLKAVRSGAAAHRAARRFEIFSTTGEYLRAFAAARAAPAKESSGR
ncbi:MAG: hypothetical protein ACRDRH_03290 [Pseudonocardia sp.]